MRLRGKHIVSPPTSAPQSRQSTNTTKPPAPNASGSAATNEPTGTNNTAETDLTASETVTAPVDQPALPNQATTNGSTSVPSAEGGAANATSDGSVSAGADHGRRDRRCNGGRRQP